MGSSNSAEKKDWELHMCSKHAGAQVVGLRCIGRAAEEALIQSEEALPPLCAFELEVVTPSDTRNWVVGCATEEELQSWEGPGDGLWYREGAWVCWDGGAIMNSSEARRGDCHKWGAAGQTVMVRADTTETGPGRVDFWVDGEWQGGLDGARGKKLYAVLLITDGEADLRVVREPPALPEGAAPCARQWRLISRCPEAAIISDCGARCAGDGSADGEVLVHADAPLLPAGVHAWDVAVIVPSQHRNWVVGCAVAAELEQWEGPGDGLWYRPGAWIYWDGGALMNGGEERRREAEKWGADEDSDDGQQKGSSRKTQLITVRVDTAETGRVDFWVDGRWQGFLDGVKGQEVYPVLCITDGEVEFAQTQRALDAMSWTPPPEQP
eukprot:TRINITY_DN28264_c0_g1_i1.p1 TRINITY_DN28264_c0_g1~~TRINITY_DN28264_c0_g1_i1.p1  ORF type:complete len:381 (+),score=97.44 TRINITY_DN28264_c0_g1_i1:77-1219(+)